MLNSGEEIWDEMESAPDPHYIESALSNFQTEVSFDNGSCIADQSLSWVRRSDQFIAMIWEKSSDQSSCLNLNLTFYLKLTSDHCAKCVTVIWCDLKIKKFKFRHELWSELFSQIIAMNWSWFELYELYTTLLRGNFCYDHFFGKSHAPLYCNCCYVSDFCFPWKSQ